MANWKLTIDVSDIWKKYEDDENFEAFKEELVAILAHNETKIERLVNEDEAEEFKEKVAEIADAEDIENFDFVWEDLYNWADYNKIWIKTQSF